MGQIEIKSNARAARSAMENALRRALRIIGMKAESYAKQLCPVDTGLLRNSITYALDGEPPANPGYGDNKGEQTGAYTGAADPEPDGKMSVYIGTNVEYAPYQELGHHTTTGAWVNPRPFIRPAMENHLDEYKRVIQAEARKV